MVSIPFDQGDVFRQLQIGVNSVWLGVSIPFDQGDVFRHRDLLILNGEQSLNPFRSGRCLSTYSHVIISASKFGLNPFRSGRCLSTVDFRKSLLRTGLNPFRSGRCLSTAAVCWRQESCGLSDPLPNFFGGLRSWLLI